MQILQGPPMRISIKAERLSDKEQTKGRYLHPQPMTYSLTVERLSYTQMALGQHQVGRPTGSGAEAARVVWNHEVEISKFSSLTINADWCSGEHDCLISSIRPVRFWYPLPWGISTAVVQLLCKQKVQSSNL